MSSRNTAEIIKLPTSGVSRRVATVKRVRAAVDKKTRYLLEGMSANSADALFEEMNHLPEETAMECHFNIMRSLKTEGDMLAREFAQLMDKSWMNLVHRRDKQALADAPPDVTPILKQYSDKYLNHYKILLEELRIRFSRLSRRKLAFHPLLPGNFYLCFWHATESLDLTYQERKLLVPLFHRFVMDRFGQVLSIGNQTLVDLGIPAQGEKGEQGE